VFFRRKILTCNFIVSFDFLKLLLPTQPIFQRVHFSLLVKPSVEIAPVSLPKNRFGLAFTFCKALCQQLPSRSDSRIYLRFYVFSRFIGYYPLTLASLRNRGYAFQHLLTSNVTAISLFGICTPSNQYK